MDREQKEEYHKELTLKGLELGNLIIKVREDGGDPQCLAMAAQDLENAIAWIARCLNKMSLGPARK